MCVCVNVLSCVQLYDPLDCSPPDSSIHEIFQARILQWVAISSSISAITQYKIKF